MQRENAVVCPCACVFFILCEKDVRDIENKKRSIQYTLYVYIYICVEKSLDRNFFLLLLFREIENLWRRIFRKKETALSLPVDLRIFARISRTLYRCCCFLC